MYHFPSAHRDTSEQRSCYIVVQAFRRRYQRDDCKALEEHQNSDAVLSNPLNKPIK